MARYKVYDTVSYAREWFVDADSEDDAIDIVENDEHLIYNPALVTVIDADAFSAERVCAGSVVALPRRPRPAVAVADEAAGVGVPAEASEQALAAEFSSLFHSLR